VKAFKSFAWIFENRIGDKDRAISEYNAFLEKYPDSEYSRTVRIKLDIEKPEVHVEVYTPPVSEEAIDTSAFESFEGFGEEETKELETVEETTPEDIEEFFEGEKQEEEKKEPDEENRERKNFRK
jgi:hypothetical protein